MDEFKKKLYPVSMIGTGPGDPELLTVKAQKRIQEADCILYDCLPATYVLTGANENAKVKYVNRHPENGPVVEDILEVARDMYLEGKKVVRIKAGDAMMFNGGGVDYRRLCEMGVEVEVIPGLTAACAASNIFSIPITEKYESNSIIYAIGDEIKDDFQHFRDIARMFRNGTTLALYMAFDNLKDIFKVFKEEGVKGNMPVAITAMVSLKGQSCEICTMDTVFETIEKKELFAPFVFFVGEHVDKNHSLLNQN